ncbi:AsnC family transcriptional regulator [Pectobacterium brasiliense]|uniref:Lrp/AsnC family transcriptional regulator n=1 Tax=Pectobacterium brasiliense TaxID=180957 RepID=UPI0004E60FCF|nr:Lrp/AsnC family transcriptional regulator [Pectobacterium brasiliense]KFF65198.1 AsnC family transcriptional regulator [Pectobacterium brasiliense]GLY59199.1 transcriptional regulator [Pectobacterium carotovorum subsp. carotovorum]
MPTFKLDSFDRKILTALQIDGRLSNIELSEKIGLSASPCLRRVRNLEKQGIIRGYAASLDRDQVGLGVTVMVGLKVEKHDYEQATQLREALGRLPEVISAYLVSGDSDFLLHVVVPDLKAYEVFHTTVLLQLPGVRDIRSTFAIQVIKEPAPLPLNHIL